MGKKKPNDAWNKKYTVDPNKEQMGKQKPNPDAWDKTYTVDPNKRQMGKSAAKRRQEEAKSEAEKPPFEAKERKGRSGANEKLPPKISL